MRARHGVDRCTIGILQDLSALNPNTPSNWKPEHKRKKARPTCGARCRDGHACKAKAVVDSNDSPINGRCRMHGGLSTGPKTEEGKARSREASRKRMLEFWRRKKLLEDSLAV